MGSNPAQGNYSFPQKLSSVEFPVTFSQFLLNLECESICDPPGGDTLLAQGIYLTVSLSIYIYNCRQYCFGLLGLISAVLMSRMEVKLIKPPQMSHTCGTSKPCQSAQTSELVIYIFITWVAL